MSAIDIFSARRYAGDDDGFAGQDIRATSHTIRDMRDRPDAYDKHPAGIVVEVHTPSDKLYEVIIAEDQLIAALAGIASFREELRGLRDDMADIFKEPYCACDGDC